VLVDAVISLFITALGCSTIVIEVTRLFFWQLCFFGLDLVCSFSALGKEKRNEGLT
jgi:hypothetical protein